LGKLRPHIERPDHALAEWISRKLTNHDPMSVREKTRRTHGVERVRHVEGTQTVEYCAGDQVFLISVELVDEPKIKVKAHG
jgi:hypothetical protein